MCGLIQSIFVRVPVTEMRVPISKIAEGEWCADSIAAKSNKTVHVATETLPLKMASLSGMRRSITRGKSDRRYDNLTESSSRKQKNRTNVQFSIPNSYPKDRSPLSGASLG